MQNTLRALFLTCCIAGVMAATAPTLTTVGLLTGGGSTALGDEDAAFIIGYATLDSAADEADADGDAVDFRIEGVTIGTLAIRPAGSAAVATAITPGVTIITAASELVWTPSAHANGDLPAFTVVAWDGALASSGAVQVSVRVGAINDLPTLTTIATITGPGAAALGDEDTQMIITGPALAAAADEADVDGTVSAFRIASVTTGGTLGLRALGSGAAATAVVVGDLVDSTMELVWTPPLNANGTVVVCTIRAWDGSDNSAATIALSVLVGAVVDDFNNEVFSITTIPIVAGVPVTFTFEELLARTTFTDPDREAIATLRFDSTRDPATGWKFERLDSADAILGTVTAPGGSTLFIQRNEKVRFTVFSSLPTGTPQNLIGGLEFDSSDFSIASANVRIPFQVSAGGTSTNGSSGGGGCGLGAALAGLMALLGLSIRVRMWHE